MDLGNSAIRGSQSGIVTLPAAASHLVVSCALNGTAGLLLSVSVLAQDGYGNTATSCYWYGACCSSDGRAVLPSDYTFTGQDAVADVFWR